MRSKAQVTIFIILAIFIVVIVFVFFKFGNSDLNDLSIERVDLVKTCVDSDEEQDLFVEGDVVFCEGQDCKVYIDGCENENFVRKYFCENNNVEYRDLECGAGYFCDTGLCIKDESYLLETQWGQRGEYAKFSPFKERAGCWSTALAQIMYYHELLPHGNVFYSGEVEGEPYLINEITDSYDFEWDLFVNKFEEDTSEESIEQVARYIYLTSVIIQKKFGSGTYFLSHNERAKALEEFYSVDAEIYSLGDYSYEYFEHLIVDEISANRPLMLHLKSFSDLYHAVVIDGFKYKDGEFLVHINMGLKGSGDDWYIFDKVITHYDDINYKKIMTIKY